jgi:hypothetical protein
MVLTTRVPNETEEGETLKKEWLMKKYYTAPY